MSQSNLWKKVDLAAVPEKSVTARKTQQQAARAGSWLITVG